MCAPTLCASTQSTIFTPLWRERPDVTSAYCAAAAALDPHAASVFWKRYLPSAQRLES
jgi:hypothetical protein